MAPPDASPSQVFCDEDGTCHLEDSPTISPRFPHLQVQVISETRGEEPFELWVTRGGSTFGVSLQLNRPDGAFYLDVDNPPEDALMAP